jgi:hypothetical protein
VRSDRTLRRWYLKINRRFFSNELPKNVCVRYVTEEDDDEEEKCEERYCGWSDFGHDGHAYVIVISKMQNPDWRARIATLAHEMCHVSLGLKDDHGRAFEMKRQMISDRGIFKKNAIYKGYTLF